MRNLLHSLEQEEDKYVTADKRWPVAAEVYRRKFAIMIERLKQVGRSDLGYKSAEALLADLVMVSRSLSKHHPMAHELKAIKKLIRQVQLFGFHLATLDIRNHSGEHEGPLLKY